MHIHIDKQLGTWKEGKEKCAVNIKWNENGVTLALLILFHFLMPLKTISEFGAYVQFFAAGPQRQTLETTLGPVSLVPRIVPWALFPSHMYSVTQKNGTPVEYMKYPAMVFSILLLQALKLGDAHTLMSKSEPERKFNTTEIQV